LAERERERDREGNSGEGQALQHWHNNEKRIAVKKTALGLEIKVQTELEG